MLPAAQPWPTPINALHPGSRPAPPAEPVVQAGFDLLNRSVAAAIIGMTKVWAMELGRYNITVNCIAPGFITTAMTDKMPEEIRKQSIPTIPLGKWGVPDDIANGYLYLASDEASFVSGICLTIDGGAAR